MSVFKKRGRQIAVVPAVAQDSAFSDSITEWNFSEFDIQPTADTENDFPLIAQGYPISGFKEFEKKGKKFE